MHDDDLESALDDIFGADFIEIDVKKDDKSTINTEDKLEPKISETQNKLNDFNDDMPNFNYQDIPFDNEKTYLTTENSDDKNHEDKNNNLKNKKNNKKKIISIIIVSLILLLLIIMYFIFGVTRTISCSSSAVDKGYKYIDQYKISYKNNDIIYIESNYTYTALNNEYKEQIQYVKQEKLPVIINSNGMPGFTYIYETSDDYFKVNGYLDFELIKFDDLDKIDQDLKPVSYYKINSKTTYKSFKKQLEKDGYKCVLSK